MAWFWLVIAGLLEMIGVLFINEYRKSEEKKNLLYFALAFAGSFALLRHIMTVIPMATTYAIWTGIGASGGALIGILLYGESKDPRRLACIGLIILGAVGLRLVS